MAALFTMLPWLSVEGLTPPLVVKIDDDVEGVEGEGVLMLKSMRRGRRDRSTNIIIRSDSNDDVGAPSS